MMLIVLQKNAKTKSRWRLNIDECFMLSYVAVLHFFLVFHLWWALGLLQRREAGNGSGRAG